ncbi:hypothetical protein AB6A40_003276 [Gnathostoma spinigerum]|uniref:Secreted protein n=1 Tax=Gnathostoma spinigerum TaxID=75299 RepID=A0ABD6EJ29_9BILA
MRISSVLFLSSIVVGLFIQRLSLTFDTQQTGSGSPQKQNSKIPYGRTGEYPSSKSLYWRKNTRPMDSKKEAWRRELRSRLACPKYQKPQGTAEL